MSSSSLRDLFCESCGANPGEPCYSLCGAWPVSSYHASRRNQAECGDRLNVGRHAREREALLVRQSRQKAAEESGIGDDPSRIIGDLVSSMMEALVLLRGGENSEAKAVLESVLAPIVEFDTAFRRAEAKRQHGDPA